MRLPGPVFNCDAKLRNKFNEFVMQTAYDAQSRSGAAEVDHSRRADRRKYPKRSGSQHQGREPGADSSSGFAERINELSRDLVAEVNHGQVRLRWLHPTDGVATVPAAEYMDELIHLCLHGRR